MNITELLAKYRAESNDDATSSPYVTDARLLILFNEAIDEACTRKPLIFDDTTSAICSISVTIGQVTKAISPKIVHITKAYLTDAAGDIIDLKILCREELDWIDPTWRTNTGEPTAIIVDELSVRLNSVPEVAYTLKLEVYRTPADTEKLTLTTGNPAVLTPFIAEAHHKYLHHYPLSIVYLGDEPDMYAPGKAKFHKEAFDHYFGPPVNADRRRKSRENRPHVNKLW